MEICINPIKNQNQQKVERQKHFRVPTLVFMGPGLLRLPEKAKDTKVGEGSAQYYCLHSRKGTVEWRGGKEKQLSIYPSYANMNMQYISIPPKISNQLKLNS